MQPTAADAIIGPLRLKPGAGRQDRNDFKRWSKQGYNPAVNVRYYIDPATRQPHVYQDDVTEAEVEDVLNRPLEDRPGTEGSRVALGQTEGGRYLRVIYVPDPQPESVFVITAYQLGPKALKALRRRRKKKP